MSIGVNASLKSISELSKLLSGYEVSIEETHHRNKLDSPSGTALKIAEVVGEARNTNSSQINIKSFREEGEVGIHKPFLNHQMTKLLSIITHITEQYLRRELLIHRNGSQAENRPIYTYSDYMRYSLRLAVIFPGQGSQNKDMAECFSNESCFNDIVNMSSEILNYDIREAIKDDFKINDTVYTQPLMLTILCYVGYINQKHKY